jgi:hypothetical protein
MIKFGRLDTFVEYLSLTGVLIANVKLLYQIII